MALKSSQDSKPVESNSRPVVVVVGAGVSGLSFVQSIQYFAVNIILVDRSNSYVHWSAVYQELHKHSLSDSCLIPLEDVDLAPSTKRIVSEVLGVDQGKKELITSSGTIAFDYLVVATGRKANFFSKESIKQNAVTLNSAEDIIKMKDRIIQLSKSSDHNSKRNVIIVGGGKYGVELAAAFNSFFKSNGTSIQIHLVEGDHWLLPTMRRRSGRKAEKKLTKSGVKVKAGRYVSRFEGKTLKFQVGDSIDCDLMVWIAGKKGTILNGFRDDQRSRDCYKVDEFNQVLGSDHIFAVGDVATYSTKSLRNVPKSLASATQQGIHLAKNFKRLLRHKDIKSFKFKRKFKLVVTGKRSAVVETKLFSIAGFMGWMFWAMGQVFVSSPKVKIS